MVIFVKSQPGICPFDAAKIRTLSDPRRSYVKYEDLREIKSKKF